MDDLTESQAMVEGIMDMDDQITELQSKLTKLEKVTRVYEEGLQVVIDRNVGKGQFDIPLGINKVCTDALSEGRKLKGES